MSFELFIRFVKKLKEKGKKKRDFGKSFEMGSGVKVFQVFLVRNYFLIKWRTFRGRYEFLCLCSFGFGNRVDIFVR